jgi:type II secretory pathway pseudopilin PulG
MPLYPSKNKFQVPFSHSGGNSVANAGTLNILSFEATSGLVTVPSFVKSIKIASSILFTTNPIAQTFDLRVIAYGTGTVSASLGTATQALTCTPESNNGSNSWRFEITMASPLLLPSGGKTVADRVGFWTLFPTIVNNSGGTLVTVGGVWSRGVAFYE